MRRCRRAASAGGEPVHLRHHHVEDHQVGRRRRAGVDRFHAGAHGGRPSKPSSRSVRSSDWRTARSSSAINTLRPGALVVGIGQAYEALSALPSPVARSYTVLRDVLPKR